MSEIKNIEAFKISEIASWQTEGVESKVSLPSLQRGFVWNARRIEDLWDSLLKGYPIGSFLMASSRTGHFDLLDGQQRATALAIGTFNPWVEAKMKFWKIKGFPVLWLDIDPTSANHRFKVVTHSHPWGYDQKSERLKADDRRKAFDEMIQVQINSGFDKKYYELSLNKTWPWFSSVPIPFCFFLESDVDLKDTLAAKAAVLLKCTQRLRYISAFHQARAGSHYKTAINTFLDPKNHLSDILIKSIRDLMSNAVPAIIVPYEVVSTEKFTPKNWREESPVVDLDDDSSDVMVQLFERVNSGGVTLGGDDLVYSIFKSGLPGADDIGKKCDYIKPSRLMNLAIRLVMTEGRRGNTAFPRSIKVREFREWLEQEDNRRKLSELIQGLDHEENPFRFARNLLLGSSKDGEPWRLSFFQAFDLTNRHPDAFFLLLYRLYRGDKLLTPAAQKRALAFLTTLAWFSDKKEKGLRQACESIWKHRGSSETSFWTYDTLSSAIGYGHSSKAYKLIPPCPPADLAKFLNRIQTKSVFVDSLLDDRDVMQDFFNSQRFHSFYEKFFDSSLGSEGANEEIEVESKYHARVAIVNFVNILRESEGILAYACRRASKAWFDDYFHKSLEDVERPWDTDHIYPTELANARRKSKRNHSGLDIVKDWHGTIANKRLWPLELNRSDSADAPQIKLNFSKRREVFARYGMKEEADLFAFSSIAISDINIWLELGDNPKEAIQAKSIVEALSKRIVHMYRDWYESLDVGALLK